MKLRIRRAMAESLSDKAVKGLGNLMPDRYEWRFKKAHEISLVGRSEKWLKKVESIFQAENDRGVKGANLVLRDIERWRESKNDAANAKPRSLLQFEGLLAQYLKGVEGHRVYCNISEDDEADTWVCYYVSSIEYKPPRKDSPAHVTMSMHYSKFGESRTDYATFWWQHDAKGRKVSDVLASRGYMPETKDLRADYLAQLERYEKIAENVGLQVLAVGEGEFRDGYWGKSVSMTRDGHPSKCVIDVFEEDDEGRGRRYGRSRGNSDVTSLYWDQMDKSKADDESEDDEEIGDDDAQRVEVPIHPYVKVFDLSKHRRVSMHIKDLTVYEYDDGVQERLVLPPDLKSLVTILVEHKSGGFQDVVAGKGDGAVVLLAGPPGVGKTLTAEVYAESERRPLYSVQCSQLGTNAEELEEELRKCFMRASRWNAVMLLDEADVYVHRRGNDMQQNAIVGVFLRVLEYQDSVLFLTTNRADDVDDAVLSRCVARVPYKIPSAEEQEKLWSVLSQHAGIKLAPPVIKQIVKENPGITGRDVKNLLKLANLISRGKPITAKGVKFARQFQPTEIGDGGNHGR